MENLSNKNLLLISGGNALVSVSKAILISLINMLKVVNGRRYF